MLPAQLHDHNSHVAREIWPRSECPSGWIYNDCSCIMRCSET